MYLNLNKQIDIYYNRMVKYNSAYILSHNGLGDHISMIGSVNFLLNHYDTVYLLCKERNESNVKLLLANKKVITVPFNESDEFANCRRIIASVYFNKSTDIFVCGLHKSYLRSKITNPSILNYNEKNKYGIKYKHIAEFYNDMNLNLNIYYDYFNIASTKESIELYENVKHLNVVFCHTQASHKKIDISEHFQQYKNNNDYILVCANENVYNKTEKYFEIANIFVNKPVQQYIDVIKNAHEIFIINSCFACIVYPLDMTNKLSAKKIHYFGR